MFRLYIIATIAVLVTNEAQGWPLGDFPIKTLPGVLSDVTRIIGEAKEKIGETRSSLRAIISSLSSATTDQSPEPLEPLEPSEPLEPQLDEQESRSEDATELKCRTYQLAFGRRGVLCLDLEIEVEFDNDTRRLVLGDVEECARTNEQQVTETFRKIGKFFDVEENESEREYLVAFDGAESSLVAREFDNEDGSGGHESELTSEDGVKFGANSDNEKSDAKTSVIGNERKVQDPTPSLSGEMDRNVAGKDDVSINADVLQDVINVQDVNAKFLTCLMNRFKKMTGLFAKRSSANKRRYRRGSARKGPVPRIIISF